MSDLDKLLQAAHQAAQLALTQFTDAEGVRPIVILVTTEGAYQWTAKGKTSAQLLELFGRIISGLAVNQQPPIYICQICSEPGHPHGRPPFPGWFWTPSGALLCPACRADLEVAPVLQLVPPLEGKAGSDEPDLAQAPSPDGTGPVPLFLDGESTDEEMLAKLEAEARRLNEQERRGG